MVHTCLVLLCCLLHTVKRANRHGYLVVHESGHHLEFHHAIISQVHSIQQVIICYAIVPEETQSCVQKVPCTCESHAPFAHTRSHIHIKKLKTPLNSHQH